jgi:hypothetical protein
MTSFERGDIVLLSYPVNDALEMHLRPAMVVQDAHAHDAGIALVPITAEPSDTYLTLHLPLGSFEAARFGLMTSGYLTACEEVVVEREFIRRKIGRCPWQMLQEFVGMMRAPLVRRKPGVAGPVAEPVPIAAKGLVRQAV